MLQKTVLFRSGCGVSCGESLVGCWVSLCALKLPFGFFKLFPFAVPIR